MKCKEISDQVQHKGTDMNESFVFYRSFAEALEQLPPEQYKEAMVAICRYGLDGVMENTEDPVCHAIMTLVKPQIDANAKRRESGRKGADSRWHSDSKSMANDSKPIASVCEPMPNANANANANVNANVKEKGEKKAKRFLPPSVSDVAAYCRERNNGIKPQQFVDFYTSKGWKIGKNPMKDWKAAVRTWEQKDDTRAAPARYGEQRADDLDAMLINQIIGRGG